MRKIALVSEHASPLGALGGVDSGGQNVYVAQIATQLARRGWGVDVFTRADAVGLPETMRASNGVRVVNVPAGPSHHVRKEDLLPYMGEFTDFVAGYARREDYDLIHANFFMSGLVAADLKARLGVPYAITFHALGKVRRLHQGASDGFPDERFAIEERVAAEADRIIAECPADEEDLVTLYGADPARISVIPCGFDPDELWPVDRADARARLGFGRDESVILQLGRMVPRKGVETVIRSLARLRERGAEPRLVVAGGESVDPDPRITPEIGRLLDVAASCGVDDLVHFAGSKSRGELRDYYSAADAFVTVPWYEPFGITPLEAMACATPVVGSDVGGIRYTVADGETGFLIPPKDEESLAARLAALLGDEALARRMGEAGRRRVLERFTWAEVARRIEAAYDAALAPAAPTVSLPAARMPAVNPAATVSASIDASVAALIACKDAASVQVAQVAHVLGESLRAGGKVLVCGNGGSAADAQHFAGELVCKFRRHDRVGLPVLALGTDASVTTAWSNDVGFDEVFARQVEAFGAPGDVLVAISTSGRSSNVCRALEAARARGLRTVALLGGDGGDAIAHADVSVVVPCADTPRVQEVQMALLHALAEIVEASAELAEDEPLAVAPVVPVRRAGGGSADATGDVGHASGLSR